MSRFITKYNNTAFILYKWSLLLLLLSSFYAWFFNSIPVTLFSLIAIVFGIYFRISVGSRIFRNVNGSFFPLFTLFAACMYIGYSTGFIGVIVHLFTFVCFGIVLMLEDNIKKELLAFITKAMAIILSVSLIMWIVFLFGITLPATVINMEMGSVTYNLYNYYFFLTSDKSDFLFFLRFSSIFIEPGHLGVLTSFLLFANKFELKRKEILVIFISALFTFSLAAYILMIISYYLLNSVNVKGAFRNIIVVSILMWGVYAYFGSKHDSIIYTLIISRLEFVDGDLKGNNRTSTKLDSHYEDIFNTNKMFLGIGSKFTKFGYSSGNAGYKPYILRYGLVGALLIFLLYFSITRMYKSIFCYIFLLIIILSFLQRANPLRAGELLIFITAMPNLLLQFQNMSSNKKNRMV